MTPAAVVLPCEDRDLVQAYLDAMRVAGRRTGRSVTTTARTCQAKLAKAGGWSALEPSQQIDVAAKARSYCSWLMVTGRLVVTADLISALTLHLGQAARLFCPQEHAWFVAAASPMSLSDSEVQAQWNLLAKVAVITGVSTTQVGQSEFLHARAELLRAYRQRGMPRSGAQIASVFNRLQLTLFNADRLTTWKRPTEHQPIAVTGWAHLPPTLTATARRYLEQVSLSLRPSTVKAIEHDLRRFTCWLAATDPQVTSCTDLRREHLEAYKTWLANTPTPRTGAPLNRVSVKNTLINLHCYFTRTAEWGYPDAPIRPLLFVGDLPLIDKPLPRFLDDAAATKLLRAARADPDPLSRLIVELLARTGIRRGELLNLTVDAVVQIGSSYWLRIPIGKLHNDRYIPLHPDLKTLLDDWVEHHRPPRLRTRRLLVEHHRPISNHRITAALDRHAADAGIAHVTAHQLRHTLATQAINRGMSLDAIAALLGHKTLAMTMVYARIADRTVAEQYFAVTEKVESLYGQPAQLPATDETTEMRKLRAEMHRRMLGNGYCARPVELDCHFESICEACSFFVTTIEFRPTLQAQRDDAATKGQIGRQKIFDGPLNRLDTHTAS